MNQAARSLAAEASPGAPESRALIVATAAALATLAPVAAHQFGMLDRLPDPPGRIFASDQITGSRAAHPFGIPDGILGIGSYTATLALVLLAQAGPKARKLLALKLVADGSLAGFNVIRQVVSFRKLCSWCTGTAICTAAMLVAGRKLITQEVRAATGRQAKTWRPESWRTKSWQ